MMSGCSRTIADYPITAYDKQCYKSTTVTNGADMSACVLETRGSGEIACINLGKLDGIKLGDKIDFYRIKNKHGKKFAISFANGRVIELSLKSSWVSVKNYQTAGVKENTLVRKAVDQSYSLGEKMLYPPRFFQHKQ